jgi:N-methylhydantoinase A
MLLDHEAAHAALEQHIARPLAMDVLQAADGILRIAANAMSYAIRGVTTQRGIDSASLTLIAYGGAGPLHATSVASEVGIRRVIIPAVPGNFCAYGMLFSDLRYDVSRTWLVKLSAISPGTLEAIFEEMVFSGRQSLCASGVKPASVSVNYACDMRYVGQEHAVTVDLAPDIPRDQESIKKQFDEYYLRRYGVNSPYEAAEIVGLRVAVVGLMKKPTLPKVHEGSADVLADARTGVREAYFREIGKMAPTPTFRRDRLLANNIIMGPALVEEETTTTVVGPQDKLTVDGLGNLVIDVGLS